MKPLSTMNVIPFIDIMLVLLAVVLTTATFVAQGKIPLDLPSAPHAQALASEPALEISVTRDGALFVGESPVTTERLASRLTALPVQTRVLLRIDEQAEFRHFVRVIDHLKSRGLNNVSIVTRRGRR